MSGLDLFSSSPGSAPGPGGRQRLMLAIAGRLRRPRVVRGGPDFERWARAWARRWWVVEADSADLARRAITRYDEACARVGLGHQVDAANFGIVEAGRNAAGGPDPPRSIFRGRRRAAGRPNQGRSV